jgi:predicted membrane-bound spermidine synthase
MSKSTITRLFIGGALAVVSGSVLAIGAIWIATLNGVFVMNGADIVRIQGSALAWSTLGVAIVAASAVVAGFIAGLVSWIGALLNTSQLDNRAWFVALLLLGIFSLGLVAMVAYVLVGPDGSASPVQRAQVRAGANAV